MKKQKRPLRKSEKPVLFFDLGYMNVLKVAGE